MFGILWILLFLNSQMTIKKQSVILSHSDVQVQYFIYTPRCDLKEYQNMNTSLAKAGVSFIVFAGCAIIAQ